MSNEYIVINKTELLKRIEKLDVLSQHNERVGEYDCEGAIISELKEILSQSTPLIPVLEQAYFEGECYGIGTDACTTKQDYISNLKLDI